MPLAPGGTAITGLALALGRIAPKVAECHVAGQASSRVSMAMAVWADVRAEAAQPVAVRILGTVT